MFRLSSVFFILIVAFLWSCQSSNELNSPNQLSLTSNEIQVDILVTEGNLSIYKDYILKRANYRADTVLQVIDIKKFNNCFNTIRKGKGPGEVANPAALTIDESNGILWLTDWGKNCIHKINLDSLLKDPDYKPSYSFPLNKSWIPTMNMFCHPSGLIGFTSVMLQSNLVSFMNQSGELVDSVAIPNWVYPDIWDNGGISDNPLICRYVPENNRMIIASRHENKFAIIEMDGTPVFQKKDFPGVSEKIFIDWEASYYDVFADQTFVYFVYLGRSMGEFDAEGNFNLKYPNRLLVVDWKGNFRYDIELEHGIIYGSIDKKQKLLFCVAQDIDNYLISYDLSSLY